MKKVRIKFYPKVWLLAVSAICLLTISSCQCDCDDAKNENRDEDKVEENSFPYENSVKINAFTTGTCPSGCPPDPDCKAACTTTACEDYVVCCHEIDQTTFDQIVCNDGEPVKEIQATVIWNAYNGKDCSKSKFRLSTKNVCDDNTNNDIGVYMLTSLDKLTTEVDYSIPLFKGLKRKFETENNPIQMFRFYEGMKTVNGTSKPDIVFEALNVNNQVVYLGDLSDLFP